MAATVLYHGVRSGGAIATAMGTYQRSGMIIVDDGNEKIYLIRQPA